MNKSKNESQSFIKKISKKNRHFDYLQFLKPLENDANKEYVYPSFEEIKKYGYHKYHTMFKNNVPYLYNSEPLHCNIYNDHKEYGKDFNVQNINGLKVISWNVHNWVQICNSNHNRSKKRKVKEFISFIDQYKPDIVCLQEIVPNNEISINQNISNFNQLKKLNFTYICKLFKSYGYEYNIIANANVDATYIKDDNDYFYLANGIFSKIPIQKYYLFSIPFNRNIMIIKILYNNKTVYIVNTHLEFKNGLLKKEYSKFDLYQKVPYKIRTYGFQLNMNILLELLSKIKSNNIIVCGDFNHSYGGNYKRQRLELGKKVFIPFMNVYHDTTIYPNISNRITNLKNNLTSDFIFLHKKSNLQVEKSYLLFTDLSDHYPVFSSFYFT